MPQSWFNSNVTLCNFAHSNKPHGCTFSRSLIKPSFSWQCWRYYRTLPKRADRGGLHSERSCLNPGKWKVNPISSDIAENHLNNKHNTVSFLPFSKKSKSSPTWSTAEKSITLFDGKQKMLSTKTLSRKDIFSSTKVPQATFYAANCFHWLFTGYQHIRLFDTYT